MSADAQRYPIPPEPHPPARRAIAAVGAHAPPLGCRAAVSLSRPRSAPGGQGPGRIATRIAAAVLWAALAGFPRVAVAQRDTARVSYRTAEVIFVSAGRARGIAVGDTLTLLAPPSPPSPPAGGAAAIALVTSVADSSASARLVNAAAAASVGQLVTFRPHSAAELASLAAVPTAPDTGVAAAPGQVLDTTQGQERPPPPPPPAPAPAYPPRIPTPSALRWRGSFQLDEVASTVASTQSISSYQTTGSVSLTAPLAEGLTFITRGTTRWRNGSSTSLLSGIGGAWTAVYQAEIRAAPPGQPWNLSLGRFVPSDAVGLGFLDGARIEIQPGGGQRIGVVGGFVPDPIWLRPATSATRAGAYWALTAGAFSGSVSGAGEWQDGARRRTWFSAQSFWAASSGLSVFVMTDLDFGSGWQSFRGLQITNLSAGIRTALPGGFRGGLSVQSNQAIQIWSLVAAGDTFALPGRLSGATLTLGHDLAGAAVDVSGTYLKRVTDPGGTYQGTLTIFDRHFMVAAIGQHGDLFDYGSLVVRFPVPLGYAVSGALSFTGSATALPGGGQVLWRYGVRPELSYRLGGGLYASISADLGRYVGQTSVYLRGGIAYQLW